MWMKQISALLVAGICAAGSQAQINNHSYGLRLRHVGEAAAMVQVSTMRIDCDGWAYKPVMGGDNGAFRTIGIYARRIEPGPGGGYVMEAIWYERPQNPGAEWVATAWRGSTPAMAVGMIKQRYGISSAQDEYWETSDVCAVVIDDEVTVMAGLPADDSLAVASASLEGAQRKALLDVLVDSGYPVADAPSEVLGGAAQREWLDGIALACERVHDLYAASPVPEASLAALEAVVAVVSGPSAGGGTFCPPSVFHGPWHPVGEPCNCSTMGPNCASCINYTASATGTVTITFPWPAPYGTTITFAAGVGVSGTLCLCAWERTCSGPARRTVIETHSDCTTTMSDEWSTNVDFVHYASRTSPTCEGCAGYTNPPPGMPPNSQSCGLKNPVQVVP